MTTIYISIVGTQIAAVFNPLSVLEKENKSITKAVLLATQKTEKHAEAINALLSIQSNIESVIIENISESDHVDNKNRIPAHHALQKYSDEKPDLIIFNMAGGMNFQIALCAMQMIQSKSPVWYIYPAATEFFLTRFPNGMLKTPEQEILKADPNSLETEYILKIQNIKFTPVPNNKNWTDEIIKEHKIKVKIPSTALRNIQIGDVIYDYIWNEYNALIFLTSLIIVTTGKDKKQKAQKLYLESARDIIASAEGREIIQDIFHRKIIVLTDNKNQLERMDGYTKINEVLDVGAFCQKKINQIASSLIESQFKKIFKSTPANVNVDIINAQNRYNEAKDSKPKARKDSRSLNEEQHTVIEESTRKILYVVLGIDILSTLISLYSSGADEVVFLYTPENDTVKKYKAAIIENQKLLKVKKFSFCPLSITGEGALNIQVDTGKECLTVITPGTKSQGYFLTLLGVKYGGKIYSIDTERQLLFCLSENSAASHLTLKSPDPVIIQKLKGEILKNEGENREQLHRDAAFFKTLLEFMKAVINAQGHSIQRMFFQSSEVSREPVNIQIPPFDYRENEGNFMLSANYDSSQQYNFLSGSSRCSNHSCSLDGGEWFERLIGYLMLQCGADNVRVRMRMSWSEDTQQLLEKRHQNSIHRDDIDVIARFKDRYYLISCKAAKKDNDTVDSVAKEAHAFAYTFGRFCIPVVCYLKFGDNPDKPEKYHDVFVFGYNTFTNPEQMKALLEMAALDKKNKKSGN